MRIQKSIVKLLLAIGLFFLPTSCLYAADKYLISFERPIGDGTLWTQQYKIDNNQTIYKDINADGKAEKIQIGMKTQAGTKVNVICKNNSYNLFTQSQISKNQILFDKGASDLRKGFSIQVSFYDFNNDKKPEIILAAGDGSVLLFVSIFKYNQNLSNPFQEIGYFEGQESIYISKKGVIDSPYGSQGLFTQYIYAQGKIVKKENIVILEKSYDKSQKGIAAKSLKGENISETEISGINLTSSKDNIIKKFGKPKKIVYDKNVPLFTMQYKGISFTIDKEYSDIISIDVITAQYKTKRAIKIGDSESAVIKQYGKTQPSSELNVKFLQYNSLDDSYYLRFYIAKGKVVRISVNDVWN